jgi:hypothetical protein
VFSNSVVYIKCGQLQVPVTLPPEEGPPVPVDWTGPRDVLVLYDAVKTDIRDVPICTCLLNTESSVAKYSFHPPLLARACRHRDMTSLIFEIHNEKIQVTVFFGIYLYILSSYNYSLLPFIRIMTFNNACQRY